MDGTGSWSKLSGISNRRNIFRSDAKNVCTLVTTIKQICNSFLDDSEDLLNLNSKVIMPKKVIDTVRTIKDLEKSHNVILILKSASEPGKNYKSVEQTAPIQQTRRGKM